MPSISIVVPVYRVERYLRKCVDSILIQTFSDFELILVDDGSPDSCGAICEEYAKKDSRILVLHKKNGGVSSARNLGLEYAAGEYVTFCDSDDWYRPDWIQSLMEPIQNHQAEIVVGQYVRHFEDGSTQRKRGHQAGIYDLTQPEKRISYLIEKLMTPQNGWEVWTRLFPMELIRREKIRFCETCGNYAEDMGFSLKCTLFANRVVSIDSDGYCYRIRKGSMMQNSVENPKLDCCCASLADCRPVILRAFPEGMGAAVCDSVEACQLAMQFSGWMWSSGESPKDCRAYIYANTPDWPEIKVHIQDLLKKKLEYIPQNRRLDTRSHLYFLMGMPWLLLRVCCKISRMRYPAQYDDA